MKNSVHERWMHWTIEQLYFHIFICPISAYRYQFKGHSTTQRFFSIPMLPAFCCLLLFPFFQRIVTVRRIPIWRWLTLVNLCGYEMSKRFQFSNLSSNRIQMIVGLNARAKWTVQIVKWDKFVPTFGGSDKSLPISARLLPVKCVGCGPFQSSELSWVQCLSELHSAPCFVIQRDYRHRLIDRLTLISILGISGFRIFLRKR